MLSRRWRFGQPSYAPLMLLLRSSCHRCTDAQMLLLAARMPRRLPNRARQILPCLEMPATARMSAFARRAAHGECKMGSFGQTQVKLRVRLASEISRGDAYDTLAHLVCCMAIRGPLECLARAQHSEI